MSESTALELDAPTKPLIKDELTQKIEKIYRVVDSKHMAVVPVGSDEHGITGNMKPGHMVNILKWIQKQDGLKMDKESIFMDVGSEMGRPVFSAAALPIKLSVGIEMQDLILSQSLMTLKELEEREDKLLQSRCFMRFGDVRDVTTIEGVTHCFSFNIGMPSFVVNHICLLAARARSVKVLFLFDAHRGSDLIDVGVLAPSAPDSKKPAEDSSVHRMSVTMAGGGSTTSTFGLYICEMTEERRARIISKCFSSVLYAVDNDSIPEPNKQYEIDIMKEAFQVITLSAKEYKNVFVDLFTPSNVFITTERQTRSLSRVLTEYPKYGDNPSLNSLVSKYTIGYKPNSDKSLSHGLQAEYSIPQPRPSPSSTGLIVESSATSSSSSSSKPKPKLSSSTSTSTSPSSTELFLNNWPSMLAGIKKELPKELLAKSKSKSQSEEDVQLQTKRTTHSTSEIYGEVNPNFMNEIIKRVNLTKEDEFWDIGSGIGNLCFQALAQTGCKAVGVEIREDLHRIAMASRDGFERLLLQGVFPSGSDIDLSEHLVFINADAGDADQVKPDKATVVFINNFRFSEETQRKVLSNILPHLSNGTRVVTLVDIFPRYRRDSSIQPEFADMFQYPWGEYKSPHDAVSWSSKPVKYFVYIVRRTTSSSKKVAKTSSTSTSSKKQRT